MRAFRARRRPALAAAAAVLVLTAGCAAAANRAVAPSRRPAPSTATPSPAFGPPAPAVPPASPSTTHTPGTPASPSQPLLPAVAVRIVPAATVGQAPGVAEPLPAGAVALTFDDGPDPRWTQQVLAVLARYHATATFFDIGVDAERYPQLVRAEWAAGMGVGNHTWDHRDLTTLSPDEVAAEVDRAAVAIQAATGAAPVCLRPPYDGIDPAVDAVVAQQHETVMIYDVDPRDWARPGVAAIVQRVLAAARPGVVIDLHDGGGDRSETVAALPYVLQGLAARHLATVPICRA